MSHRLAARLDAENKLNGVKLIAGNIFDVSSIPHGHIFLMKHFLDRCMWSEQETIQILKNCRRCFVEPTPSGPGGLNAPQHLIIAEAVLPSSGEIDTASPSQRTSLYMDALYMLVGRERQRTRAEWEALASVAGWKIISMQSQQVPSCAILTLEKVD